MTINGGPIPIAQRSRSEWLRSIRGSGVEATRSMGQNFLVEPQVVREVVDIAGITSGESVVEIGPGHGILTRELLGRGARLTAVELDRDLAGYLRRDLANASDLSIVEKDARYFEPGEYGVAEPYSLVANLPYSTGTVIVRHFLDVSSLPRSLTVMLQREVAERMTAEPSNISLLTLGIQLFAEAEICLIVPPDAFEPAPKVESAVVKLVPRSSPLAENAVTDRLFTLATHAFQRKRKTVSNGLAMGLGIPKSDVEEILGRAGIDSGLRPQAIDIQSWIRMAEVFTT